MGPPAIQRTSVRPKDLLYLRTLEDVMKIPEPMTPWMTRAIALVAPNSFLNLIFLEEGGVVEDAWTGRKGEEVSNQLALYY